MLAFVVIANLVRSRVGRSLVAIRDNEIAAEVSGIDVARTKIIAFGVSAAIAGIGGAMLALLNGNPRVNPTSFTLLVSIYLLVAVVVGGAATIIGPGDRRARLRSVQRRHRPRAARAASRTPRR